MTRLNASRSAIGDSGEEQRLIKTPPRKGFRFVGAVHETNRPTGAALLSDSHVECSEVVFALPDKPSIAVLPFQNMSGDPEHPSRSILRTGWLRRSLRRFPDSNGCS